MNTPTQGDVNSAVRFLFYDYEGVSQLIDYKEIPSFRLPYPIIVVELKGTSTEILAKQEKPNLISCYRLSGRRVSCDTFLSMERGGVRPGILRGEDYMGVAKEMMQVLATLCLSLQCSNVRAEARTRPKKPKTRWGKVPKGEDTYHTLTVDVTPTEHHPEGAPTRSQTPRRQHWRRGHIRKLKDGRKIWIQSHLAGDPSLGFVGKDYKVARS